MIKVWTNSNGKVQMQVRGSMYDTTKETRAIVAFVRQEYVDAQQRTIDGLETEVAQLEKALADLTDKARKQAQLCKGTVRT